MRQFYNCFPIHSTLWSELSWSHYKLLIRLKSKEARDYYMEESVKSNWSVRALERQIGTHYYERIISSRDKQIVEQEAKEKTLQYSQIKIENEREHLAKAIFKF